MEKEFIPYTEALELKALGFDEPCFGWFRSTLIPSNFTEYFLETKFGMNESPSDWVNSNFLDKACSAPLYQQAFRWFRDEHKLFGQVNVCTYFIYDMSNNDGFHPTLKMIKEYDKLCNNYEESELECLKKLIEIVKNK